MNKYTVEITRTEAFARENLRNPFLWLYIFNQKKLFNILMNGKDIRQYRTEHADFKAVFIQEGELGHLQKEKEKLEKFLYGNIEDIEKDSPYRTITKDGRLNNVINRLKKIRDYPGKAIMSFFNNMGIFISLKIE